VARGAALDLVGVRTPRGPRSRRLPPPVSLGGSHKAFRGPRRYKLRTRWQTSASVEPPRFALVPRAILDLPPARPRAVAVRARAVLEHETVELSIHNPLDEVVRGLDKRRQVDGWLERLREQLEADPALVPPAAHGDQRQPRPARRRRRTAGRRRAAWNRRRRTWCLRTAPRPARRRGPCRAIGSGGGCRGGAGRLRAGAPGATAGPRPAGSVCRAAGPRQTSRARGRRRP
jgi:hypothetical protein